MPRGGAPLLLRRHLLFWDEKGAVVPYVEIGRRGAAKVTLNVVFSKTDQSGFGRRPSHLRQPEREEVCIVTILEHWVATTRDGFAAAVRSSEVKMVLDGFGRFYDKNHPHTSRLKLAYGSHLLILS